VREEEIEGKKMKKMKEKGEKMEGKERRRTENKWVV